MKVIEGVSYFTPSEYRRRSVWLDYIEPVVCPVMFVLSLGAVYATGAAIIFCGSLYVYGHWFMIIKN